MSEATRSTTKDRDACPACDGHGLTEVLRVSRIPGHVGVLKDTREAALAEPAGDIELAWCDGCGLVFNRIYDAALVPFGPDYDTSLVHSKFFRAFQEAVVQDLVRHLDLQGGKVLEIGSGKGHFLRRICELGGCDGIGIDPSTETLGTQAHAGRTMEFVQEYYSEHHESLDVDLVCCLSVFEDIPRPLDMLRSVRRLVDSTGAGIYFEIFNALRAFEARETWTVHYEQCNYFGLESFSRMFEWAGFRLTRAAACYGGDQYLQVEAEPGEAPADLRAHIEARGPLEIPPAIGDFGRYFRAQHAIWTERLREIDAKDRRCVVWGSGGKGITFLNALDTRDSIEHVVDIHPGRQGKYIPGTGQRIVSPEFLQKYRPDDVIITNALYEDEIRQQTAELGVQASFHIA